MIRGIRQGISLFQVSGPVKLKGPRNVLKKFKDVEYGGNGRLRVPPFDAVTKDGSPVSLRIRVHDERSGILVREVWSDGTGQWLIENIKMGIPYTVICYDHTLKYDPQAFASVLAETML